MNFDKVLVIGPNYKRRNGGISSVLFLYSNVLRENFKFLPSIYFQNIFLSTLLFPINLLCIGAKLCLDRSINIIHLHGSHQGSFIRKHIIFLICKYVFRKKVIYHIHSSHFHKFYNETNQLLRSRISHMVDNSDLVIVLSEEWKLFFTQSFSPKKICVLENIVENPNYHEENVLHGKLKLLFLGRIGERKGIFDLLKVITKHKLPVEVSIGGDGQILKLKQIIENNNLTNVNFLGWITGEQKKEVLKTTNVFVLPSYDEGLPISILEAMSYKKAIIATKVGGIPRIVKDKINGFIISPGDSEELAKAIKNYILKPELIKLHGENSLNLVQEYYPDSVLKKLNEIYGELV